MHSHTNLVFRGTNIPSENIAALVQFAAQCGFEVVSTTDSPLGDIVDLEGHLKACLNDIERLSYFSRSCLEPYAGFSLYGMQSLTLEGFIMRRRHKPCAYKCECLRLQTLVFELLMARGLQFNDCDPATFFVTSIEASDLPKRVQSILVRVAGIKWLQQCRYLTHADILEMKNAGPTGIEAIEAHLGAKLLAKWE